MNDAKINWLKEQYPPGTRVQLDRMGDDPRPVEAGTMGTIDAVDDMGTIFCDFDNGRQLGICPEADSFHKITQEENQAFEMSM